MASTYASYLKQKYTLKAYTVEEVFCQNPTFNGLPLQPLSSLPNIYPQQECVVIVAVGYADMNAVRGRITGQVKALGYRLGSFISPDLWLHDGVTLAEHVVILDHCSLHCNSTVGANTFISSGVHIGHDCHIGNNVWINSGVAIAGGVQIGDNCFLGVNASIAHGVALAPGTFVGANTLVTKNTDNFQVVASDPGEIFPVDSRAYLRLLEKVRC